MPDNASFSAGTAADPQRRYRAAIPQDFDSIYQILRESNLSIPRPGDRERLTHAQIGQVLTAVCELSGSVVGVLQWRNLVDEVEILDLAVSGVHRGSGHAGFLLENFLHEAVNTSARKIFLEVRESNLAAIGLYEKFGFAITGRRPNYYRSPAEAALVMHRSLPHSPTG